MKQAGYLLSFKTNGITSSADYPCGRHI